jgi:hypothetical protein
MAKRKKTRIPEEAANALMSRGAAEAPHGYCRRCWKAGTVRQGGPTPNRCRLHHQQIRQEEKSAEENAAGRRESEMESADAVFTAMKWIARETGAGYGDSPPGLTEKVHDAFWNALPDSPAATQEQVDAAHRAALDAYEKLTGVRPEPAPCPECGDQDPESRNGNNFTCMACGWSAPEGAFGAVHTAMQAGRQPQALQTSREATLRRIKQDYGFDDQGWNDILPVFNILTEEQLRAQIGPSETLLRLTWVSCNNCGGIHEELEPVDSPEYQRALEAARARGTG